MTFLYPNFLPALAFVLVPVIIHFFNFRRFKKQEFTQVKFLQQATKVKRRFRQIRDLIIMFLRMLVIACLVLAFAHPIPERTEQLPQKQQLVSIYIDNSFSMGLEGSDGELLALAKKKVEEITDGYGEEAQFNLVTNSSDNLTNDFYGKAVLLEEVEKIGLSPEQIAPKDLYKIQSNNLLRQNGQRNIVWLSDFQKNVFQLDEIEIDTLSNLYLVPLNAENVSNVNIDSAWFEQSFFELGQNATLKIKVSNLGNQRVEGRSVVVTVNGVQRALQNVELGPSASEDLVVSFAISNEGWNLVDIAVEDYPVEFDNTFFTGFYVDPHHPVLSINESGGDAFIEKVYQTSENFRFEQVPADQASSRALADYKLVILNEVQSFSSGIIDQLSDYVANGGNLVIIPSPEKEQGSYERLTSKFGFRYGPVQSDQVEIKKLELESDFFNDIFESVPNNTNYPVIKKHYKIEASTQSAMNNLIDLGNGHRFLVESTYGSGRVFSMASSLEKDWSSLSQNALFVPLMYKFATYQGIQNAIATFIDDAPGEVIVKGVGPGNVVTFNMEERSLVPEQALKNNRLRYFKQELAEPGYYALKESGKDSILSYVAFNYKREESRLNFPSATELDQMIDKSGIEIIDPDKEFLTGAFKEINDQNRWWRYFLLAALCFVIFEIIAIKLPFR